MTHLRWRRPVVALSAFFAALLIVVGAGLFARNSPAWTQRELDVVVRVNEVHSGVLSAVAHVIDFGFGPPFSALVLLAATLGIWLSSRSIIAAVRFGLLVVLPWAMVDVVKVVVHRPRLDGSLLPHSSGVDPSTYSYPSGHTAFAVALGVAIFLTVGRDRTWTLPFAVLLSVVTGWSRIYLGAHYPLDVLASIVLVPVCAWALFEAFQLVPRLATAPRTVDVGRQYDDVALQVENVV